MVTPRPAPNPEKAGPPPAASCAGENYGTSVKFLCSPAEAARQARHTRKLLLVLHVSGNFEDAGFT
jgi:hypothetical protein